MAKRTATVRPPSWWLGDTDAVCPHCGQGYVYELEFRCVECDGPGCRHCRHWHAQGYWACPACAGSHEESAEARHG